MEMAKPSNDLDSSGNQPSITNLLPLGSPFCDIFEMESNSFGNLSGLSDDPITNMLVNENDVQLSSELLSQFDITPKLAAKILLAICEHPKGQENGKTRRCEEFDTLANLSREFLPSTSPFMNIVQAIDNSSTYLPSKAPSSRQTYLPALNLINDLNDRIDYLSLSGSINAFNNQHRQQPPPQQFTSQTPLPSQLNSGSPMGSTIHPQIGSMLGKPSQHQTPLQVHQQPTQQQPRRGYGFDVNALHPEPPMSISPEIEKEAATYFQRIYNRSTSENMTIGEVLEMLNRFQVSNNKRERDLFHCMVKNLFKEYCYFPQYPDKELLLTAQLFGGIIQMDLVKYRALVDALTCILEALRQPFGSKMYFFGIAALDQFKSRLKEYPLYCRHLTTIPHFNEFPLTLREYVQFGVASKDPPSTQSHDDINSNSHHQHHHLQRQQHQQQQHLHPATSQSPVSSCHPNTGSTGLSLNSFLNVNNFNNNELNHPFNLLMPDLINNQDINLISNGYHVGSQDHNNLIGEANPLLQYNETTSINGNGNGHHNHHHNNDNQAQTILINESNSTNEIISIPIISRPSTNRNGPSNTKNMNNHNSNSSDNNNSEKMFNSNNGSANPLDNNIHAAVGMINPSTVSLASSSLGNATITTSETVQRTVSEPQNHSTATATVSSTSDQPCHASSTTTPTSYSDIVKRAKKVVTNPASTASTTSSTNPASAVTNASSVNSTNLTSTTTTSTNKDGTKMIRKAVNSGDNDNVAENPIKQSSAGTINGFHEINHSSAGNSTTSNNHREKNVNGYDHQNNGLDNSNCNSNSNNNSDDQDESANNLVNSSNCVNGSGGNNNNNSTLSKLKPTNIWAYNGLRVSNVANSCSRSTLLSLFTKFGRVKLIEKINKAIENSIWVYYDNPASPVEAAHKLQGAVIEGVSVNSSSPLRVYFAPTDDQKDLKFSRPKQPVDNKGECYYWRTTNCFSREQCPLLHIPANKNIDAQIWMGKMNKEAANGNQQQQLITQSNSK